MWLSAGLAHTCGVSTDFEAYCWGFGGSGQLGNESTDDKAVPPLVSGAHVFISVEAGNVHTCAVKDNSGSFCWGYGGDGRIGNNSFSNATRPLAVDGSLTFQSMSLGGDHTGQIVRSPRLVPQAIRVQPSPRDAIGVR